MKTKFFLYIIIALGGLLIGQFFIYKNNISDLEFENQELKEEKKSELKRVRDSSFVKITKLTERVSVLDSIVSLPPKIKWIKYEKPIYINRSLDDAIRIHSKHKTDTGTER